MSVLLLFLELKICSIIFLLHLLGHRNVAAGPSHYEKISMEDLVITGIDIIKSTFELMESVEPIKQSNLHNPAFEIGYLIFPIFEAYRKMIDKYNSTFLLREELYHMEAVIYLNDIESNYWEIEHMAVQNTKDMRKVFNDSIYNELSWSVKLLLLKDYLRVNSTSEVSAPTSTEPAPAPARRMPRMEALVIHRRQESGTTTKAPNEDDNSMRLKLFRLMYETIRDSDLKCKRAELIRSHYENSSTFEIGYLMGDVMDKYNIMADISMTLNRLFHEWKPIEHINAYEQISNQAIEINHLIDMMKSMSRHNATRSIK